MKENLDINLIEEEKNNSLIINQGKKIIKNKRTKEEYLDEILSIIENNFQDIEYTEIIKTNPSSLFDLITESKIKSWEKKLFNINSKKLISSSKSEENIFSKINTIKIEEKQVIQNDSLRTRSRESDLYPNFKLILNQTLLYYCHKTKANYKQGLNELFGGFILLKYKLPNISLIDIINLSSSLIDKYFPNYFYEKNIYSLKSAISLFQILLKYHEPTVYNKLEKCEVKPELYSLNWIINYQSSKFHIDLFYYFWDNIISINDPLFIHFFLVALIQYHRELIINCDQNYLLALMNNLPIKTKFDLDLIINKALAIRKNTPYSFRLWVNKIGFLRKDYKDIEINYEKYKPNTFMALPLFPSEILFYIYKDQINCIDSRCKNYINNLGHISPGLEFKKIQEDNKNIKYGDKLYNLRQLKSLAENHICEKCTMKLEKNFKYFIFDLRMKQNKEGININETGYLPQEKKINISQEELKSLDFSTIITNRFLNQRGIYHFIFISSETDNFNNFEKNYYKDNISEEDKFKMLFGFMQPKLKEKELNIDEAKKDLNMEEIYKLKEYDNIKKTISTMIKNNFPYVSYIYGGFEQVHKESKRFKIELLNHIKEKCYLCLNKNNTTEKRKISYDTYDKNKEEEKNILYQHLWEKKEKINYNNLSFFINNPNIKIHLGILKAYKNEQIEESKIQILITELINKFELVLYKFNKEKQFLEFESTIMILDSNKKKEYYDLGMENDIEEKQQNFELTLLEKIKVNNIISIKKKKKNKNIVNIEIKEEKRRNIFSVNNFNINNINNIVIDFSSEKDSKNFILSFKSLINMYKAYIKNK